MTKRKNPFVRIKQFFYDDGLDIHWWVDEDDHEWFLEEFSDLEPELKEERTLNGKQYNEWMIGNSYGDNEGDYVDEDCSVCQHLLVKPDCDSIYEEVTSDGSERFCSNCDFVSDSYEEYRKKEKDHWAEIRNKPEAPKFREVGQTIEQFVEKYKFGRFKKERECVTCKRIVPVSDYYFSFGYAIISYAHENCDNGGPSVAIPQGKEAEKWGKLL